MNTIRILIADDHPVFRYGLKALLATEVDMEVAGEASSGYQAIDLAGSLSPDVVLMDVNMPELNGIEATRRIVAKRPETGVLIITMLDDDSVFAAMRAGARGYLLKGSEGEDTLRAIRTVAQGGAVFSPGIAGRLMDYFASAANRTRPEPFPELTPRERQVLSLIAKGLTNAAIAERLGSSPKTVRNQVSEVYSKLQVAGRQEAAERAREAGLDANWKNRD